MNLSILKAIFAHDGKFQCPQCSTGIEPAATRCSACRLDVGPKILRVKDPFAKGQSYDAWTVVSTVGFASAYAAFAFEIPPEVHPDYFVGLALSQGIKFESDLQGRDTTAAKLAKVMLAMVGAFYLLEGRDALTLCAWLKAGPDAVGNPISTTVFNTGVAWGSERLHEYFVLANPNDQPAAAPKNSAQLLFERHQKVDEILKAHRGNPNWDGNLTTLARNLGILWESWLAKNQDLGDTYLYGQILGLLEQITDGYITRYGWDKPANGPIVLTQAQLEAADILRAEEPRYRTRGQVTDVLFIKFLNDSRYFQKEWVVKAISTYFGIPVKGMGSFALQDMVMQVAQMGRLPELVALFRPVEQTEIAPAGGAAPTPPPPVAVAPAPVPTPIPTPAPIPDQPTAAMRSIINRKEWQGACVVSPMETYPYAMIGNSVIILDDAKVDGRTAIAFESFDLSGAKPRRAICYGKAKVTNAGEVVLFVLHEAEVEISKDSMDTVRVSRHSVEELDRFASMELAGIQEKRKGLLQTPVPFFHMDIFPTRVDIKDSSGKQTPVGGMVEFHQNAMHQYAIGDAIVAHVGTWIEGDVVSLKGVVHMEEGLGGVEINGALYIPKGTRDKIHLSAHTKIDGGIIELEEAELQAKALEVYRRHNNA